MQNNKESVVEQVELDLLLDYIPPPGSCLALGFLLSGQNIFPFQVTPCALHSFNVFLPLLPVILPQMRPVLLLVLLLDTVPAKLLSSLQ